MIVPLRRALLLCLLAGVTSASAQTFPGYVSDGEFAASQAAARQREVELENRLNALDASRRADEGIRALREQTDRPALSFAPQPGPRIAPDPGGMAAIPDDRLKASNARVREAAANRR